MKIAIIGSGISGMAAGHFLSEAGHEVTLYEAASRLGGHTATIDVEYGGSTLAIDTGFIVYNDWTYPEFIALLDKLGVANRPTSMSFSVSDNKSGLEYAGSNLNTLFGQRSNLLSPDFYRMLRDILRFNKHVERHLAEDVGTDSLSLGDYLARYGYSALFSQHYIVPMGAAIWSSERSSMLQMPLRFFVRFFRNHGLLSVRDRPQWRVIEGGSRSYIEPLVASFRERIRLGCPVKGVIRHPLLQQVSVVTEDGAEQFEQVVFACHSDQALRILGDQASREERDILGSIPYSDNEVVLHTDISLLPKRRRCWSSWNVRLGEHAEIPQLTYNMNILQSLQAEQTFCVSLNQRRAINPACIIDSFHYEHPVFELPTIQAQQRWQEINGVNKTWFCGAYWRNGFHEDGVWSAKRVYEGISAGIQQQGGQAA